MEIVLIVFALIIPPVVLGYAILWFVFEAFGGQGHLLWPLW